MKKLLFISILLLSVIQLNYSQIKVSSTGNVGINNTNPTYKLDVVGTVKFTNNSKSFTFDGTNLNPSTSGTIDIGGSSNFWYHLYSMYGYFSYAPVVISDINIKTNVTGLTGMMDKIKLLNPVSYKLRSDISAIAVDKSNNYTQFGLIAQELQQIFPDMVSTSDNGVLGVRYTELIPVLIQAIKEQQTQIEDLNARIQKLESSLSK